MDGIHDLGGREGFGPVAVSTDDPAFAAPWEGRACAMVQSVGAPGSSIDRFRSLVELMPPAAYLTEPYFQKWLLVHMVELIDAEMLSRDELLSGKTDRPAPPAPPRPLAQVLQDERAMFCSFARPVPDPPAFAVGQTVRTRRHMRTTHTRLPAYARDCQGEIIARHGAHILPDESARGTEKAEHLYTLRFTAAELWGAPANPRDDVTLDLWESYLVPA